MFMDRRERRLSNRNGTPPEYINGKFRDYKNSYGGGGFFLDPSSSNILRIPSQTSSSSPPRSSSSPPYHGSSSPDRGFIEHRVSKFDTLAGVAIKYGVEVKKLYVLTLPF